MPGTLAEEVGYTVYKRSDAMEATMPAEHLAVASLLIKAYPCSGTYYAVSVSSIEHQAHVVVGGIV